jgi:cellulose synthase/poly-beta-1,6-N-acetylglucosamine synthase-like glycosyltransferase
VIFEIVRWIGYFILGYFIVMQLYMAFLAAYSALILRRNHHLARFDRGDDMLASHQSPPVSIVIPAYNEAEGIVDSVRSMSIVAYPKIEIVITNDGSKDNTLQLLIDAFDLERVRIPYRPDIETEPIRGIYRTNHPIQITVIDKYNGGRADALNAGINVARYPYALCTDADVILDPRCLVYAMKRITEDRERTIGVGGNVRPLNGSRVELGHLIDPDVPRQLIPRMQILEYLRTFVASRPAWSELDALPLVSGAFGIWKRSAVIGIGGFTAGHLGEDMDLTIRMHRHHIEREIPYRIVYEPRAVIWTEVPSDRAVLRGQRIRWHRGLMHTISDNTGIIFNPRYGRLGLVTWAGMFLFEFLAPIIEFAGWIIIPYAAFVGALNIQVMVAMLVLAYGMGLVNSGVSLLLDESFGFHNSWRDTRRLVFASLIENFGYRQLTVIWRIRAILGGRSTKGWGTMTRKGVTKLGADAA